MSSPTPGRSDWRGARGHPGEANRLRKNSNERWRMGRRRAGCRIPRCRRDGETGQVPSGICTRDEAAESRGCLWRQTGEDKRDRGERQVLPSRWAPSSPGPGVGPVVTPSAPPFIKRSPAMMPWEIICRTVRTVRRAGGHCQSENHEAHVADAGIANDEFEIAAAEGPRGRPRQQSRPRLGCRKRTGIPVLPGGRTKDNACGPSFMMIPASIEVAGGDVSGRRPGCRGRDPGRTANPAP